MIIFWEIWSYYVLSYYDQIRWLNIDKIKCICKLYDGRKIEYEEHLFVTCIRYLNIKVS